MGNGGVLSTNEASTLRKLVSTDWDALLGGAFDYNVRSHFQVLPPRLLQVITNYRCNSRCTMCNIWQMPHRHEMTLAEFAALMDPDPLFDTIDQLMVLGGEASLRTDLVELVAYFINRMPLVRDISMVSNGFLPERIVAQTEAILKLLQPRKIRLSMSVSLDGIGTMHDQVRGIPHAFEKTLATIEGLQALQQHFDFWLGSGFVVMHQNLHQAREFGAWAAARKLSYGFQLVGFHDVYVDNMAAQNEVDFRPEDREALLALIQEMAGQRSLRNIEAFYWSDMLRMYRDGATRTTPCPFTKDGLTLDAYGDVYYCLSVRKIGNALEERRSVGEIYRDPANLRFRAEEMSKKLCLNCNSACGTRIAIKKDMKKYLKFLATGSV